MLAGREFRPEWVPSFVTVLLLPLLVGLSIWQYGRYEERTAANSEAAAAAPQVAIVDGTESVGAFQDVVVNGRYFGEQQFLIDNITHEGRVGFFVVTLLALEGSDKTVAVNRGWVAADPAREQLPAIGVDTSLRQVRGRAGKLPTAGISLGGERAAPTGFPAVVVYPSVADIAAWTERELLPWALLLDADANAGYAARDWQPTGLPPERHLGYAVQWFALAVTLLILWFVFSLKKHERND